MAPPLLQLKDIALTFGGTPLLTGAELSVSTGERVSLVGRNGSGKSTLLKIAAKVVEPDRGTVFVQPGAVVRYLSQEPDFSGYASTLAYVEAGLKPSDDPYIARHLLEELGLTGQEDPAHLSGGEARRVSLAHVLAPSPDILLLDEPTNHLDLTTIEWLETRSRCPPHRAGDHQPRPALSVDAVALDRLARPRLHPPHRARLCPFRGMARHAAGGRRTRTAQARPQDRRRRALDALRRHRTAQAQHAPRRPVAGAARKPPHLPRQRRRRHHHRGLGGAVRRAGDRGQEHRQDLWRSSDRQRFLDPHPARRPYRHRRPERQRQDHADQHADRHPGARHRHGPPRLDFGDCDAQPAPRQPRSQYHGQAGADRRRGRHRFGQWRQPSTSSAT